MKIFLKREMLEDVNRVEALRNQLLVALNKREGLKRDVAAIENEQKKCQNRVTCCEGVMYDHCRNFRLRPESETPSKSDFAYWRCVEAHSELQAAKAALAGWESEEVPKIVNLEFWIGELDSEIEGMKTKLEDFVMIEIAAQEIPEPVFNSQNKSYRLPE